MTQMVRNSARFESALARYTAAAPPTTGKWKDRLADWASYAAAAGSALAFATSANAGTIYSGPQNLTLTVAENNPSNQNANTNVTILGQLFTFRLNRQGFHSFYGGWSQNGNAGFGGNAVVDDNGSQSARRLASGAAISSGLPFVGVFGANVFRQHKLGNVIGFGLTTAKGQWGASDLGFAGFRVQTGGGAHYGWFRVQLEDTNSDGFTNRMTVLDWAYSDVAGASIQAGEGLPASGAPEPGTKAMALMAFGAAGVQSLRKRRRAV